MKPKKTKKANLENKRTILLQIGMIFTLSAVLFAFEWKTGIELDDVHTSNVKWEDVEDLPPVTTQPEEQVAAVKPPSFEIEIVSDEKDIDLTDLDELISEIDPDEGFVIPVYDEKPEVVEEPYIVVQFMPTFKGKDLSSFRSYVMENIKFPTIALENGVSGTVYVEFIIEKDGSVTEIKILRGVDPSIDKEVKRVISNSPQWEPGLNNGKYVRVKLSMPVAFKLM